MRSSDTPADVDYGCMLLISNSVLDIEKREHELKNKQDSSEGIASLTEGKMRRLCVAIPWTRTRRCYYVARMRASGSGDREVIMRMQGNSGMYFRPTKR